MSNWLKSWKNSSQKLFDFLAVLKLILQLVKSLIFLVELKFVFEFFLFFVKSQNCRFHLKHATNKEMLDKMIWWVLRYLINYKEIVVQPCDDETKIKLAKNLHRGKRRFWEEFFQFSFSFFILWRLNFCMKSRRSESSLLILSRF